MKKLSLTAVFIFVFSIYSFAQSAITDALFLSRHVSDGNLDPTPQVIGILRNYIPDQAGLKDNDVIKQFNTNNQGVDSNPFIEVGGTVQSLQTSGLLSSGLSSVGGLNVTTFADGLSKFIIQRAKQEIDAAFIQRMKEAQNDYPEFKTLFPATYDVLNHIDSYQYAAMIQILKSAFERDINNLSGNIINLRELSMKDCNQSAKCKNDPSCSCNDRMRFYMQLNTSDTGQILIASAIIVDRLIKGDNPAEVLNKLAEDPIAKEESSNISNAIKISNLFSTAFRSSDANRIWVPADSVKKLLTNVDALKIFLGLIYQQNKTLQIQFHYRSGTTQQTIKFQNYLDSLAAHFDKIDQVKSFISGVGESANQVETALSQLKSQKSSELNLSFENYFQYVSSSTSFLTALTRLNKFQVPDVRTVSLSLPPDVERWVTIASGAAQIYSDIKTRNFSSAVFDAYLLLDSTLLHHFQYGDQFLKYGAFMASVIQAKNSDEVEAAIEAVALPAGSYSIKRQTKSNISLNSFLGGSYSYEFSTSNSSTNNGALGVWAPVGVCFSWGAGKSDKSCSLSIFATAIDLGAVTSFRLNDDSAEALPDFTLQNILAPGIDFVIGLPKLPLSFGFGGQFGPQLRKVTLDGIETDQSFVRLNAFLAIDIPLLNFRTGPRIGTK